MAALSQLASTSRCRNVTDDPQLRLKLRPVTEPVQRYARCLHLQEGGRVCNIRADNASTMIQDIWPTLRALEGERLPADVMVFNLGWVARPTPFFTLYKKV